MRKFLDGFRSSVSQQTRPDQEIVETLRPDNFQVAKTFRHGFPFQPTACAFDPIQHLLAIGTKSGSLRLLGRPGVDSHVRHDGDGAVLQIQFLLNEGALITVTADSCLYLWNFRQKRPEVVHSLKFQREKITYIHLPLQSKWLYVGTERGNIHVVNVETFVLSGYVINWNKAIEVSRKTHPGPVVHLSDNPLDASKLLIAYKSGQIVLWDLKTKVAELRCQSTEELMSISWHHEGKQFMCSHTDGSLTTWSTRQAPKPFNVSLPHAKTNKEGRLDPCKPIQKVEWKASRSGEAYVIFSGGLTYDKAGRTPSITVINGKTTTVLEMEHNVVDFITLCESPWVSDFQDPYAIVVLLHNDLVVIDLLSAGYPCFENPYPMDLHESPVTCCTYMADCPSDLIPAFYSVGSRTQKRTGFSEREWPLCGGEWSPTSCSYNEIILTGHADGSLKFWDASAGTLQVLYKLKTAKVFEKPKSKSVDGVSEDPFAIQLLSLCPESRKLCIAGASSHVVLFKFKKLESIAETLALEIPIVYEMTEEGECSPEYEYPPRPSLIQGKNDSNEDSKKSSLDNSCPLKVRPGPQKKPPGFQATLVCLTPYNNGVQPGQITALTINSSLGLMAYGNEVGIVIIDIVQKSVVLNMGTPDLYGSADPYQRVPRSPKRGGPGDNRELDDRCRSPSNDQALPPRNLEAPVAPVVVAISLSSPTKVSPDEDPDSVTETVDPQGYYSDVSPQAHSPEEEDADDGPQPEPKPDAEFVKPTELRRRKSTSWKGFNLKKQFSKVDQRLKNKFSVASGPEGGVAAASQQSRDKRASLFYYSSAEAGAADAAVPFEFVSPPESLADTSKDATSPESEDAAETECFKVMSRPSEAAAESREGSNTEDDCDFPSRMEDIVAEVMNKQMSRPSDLPLFDDDGKPVRPPRHKTAKKKWPDKRDLRLLSVPNIKYNKPDQSLRDLRKKDAINPVNQAPFGKIMKRFNKLDSSFSRSRSSSMSSLENISAEAIQCLVFTDSYTKKSDPSLVPTLWVGTSLGSVLTIMVNVPASGEGRMSQPVIASPCGTIFRLKGSILTMSFLDCNGSLIPYTYEPWRDESKEPKDRIKTPTKSSSPTLSGGSNQDQFGDRQFVVFASEKQARVVALPSHNCVYRQQLADTDFVVKAETIAFKDSVCLVCYISSGHVLAYTLPSLRPLINMDFLPLADLSFQTSKQGIVDPMLSIWGQQMFVNEDTDQIARTFCFSNRGHGLYLCSPTEVQKFTTSAEFCVSLTEMVGELFLAHDMPEPPKESFFKSVFGGGTRTLDREELFGEASGRASRSVAKHIPGPQANMEAINTRVGSVTGEIARTHQMVVERGEKLGQLEDTTEKMMNEAESFASTAHSLMLKNKDKKWYQL